MPNKHETDQSDTTEDETPRQAGHKHSFDEDTEREIRLPKPVPEVVDDGKKADADFDDQEIPIDEDEVSAEESKNQPPGRKY